MLVQGLLQSDQEHMLIDVLFDACMQVIRSNVSEVEWAARKVRYKEHRQEEADFKVGRIHVGSWWYKPEELYENKYLHGSMATTYGAIAKGCECEVCVDTRDAWLLKEVQLLNSIQDATNVFADGLEMDWTHELLESTFALGDGQVVSWGEATIEQHQQRIDMLTSMTKGTLETAGKHQAAINELTVAHGYNLLSIVEAA